MSARNTRNAGGNAPSNMLEVCKDQCLEAGAGGDLQGQYI
jgi:hypothetical protein